MTKFQDYLIRAVIMGVAVFLTTCLLAFTAFLVMLARGELL